MDLDKLLYENKTNSFRPAYSTMPNFLSSKHRVHRMFFKKCESNIDSYQTCLGDMNW